MRKVKDGTKRIDSYGYIRIKIGNVFVPEHRYVIESSGRKIKKNEVVHHINGNRKDNRIENLVVITRKKHNQHHYSVDKKKQNQWHKVQPLGSKSLIKIQTPRPEPTYEGQRWNHHKKRKCFIVRKCISCKKLVWQRLDNKNPKGFCLRCGCINANSMRWQKHPHLL
jgi:hypothetical protein